MSFIPGKLDNNEIIEKLIAADYPTGFKMTKNKAQTIVEMFWRMDAYNSLISQEPYLNYLIEFIQKNKNLPKSRFEFLDYIFSKFIPNDSLFKKVEKVAITMEYWQLNEINKKRFLELLKEEDITKNQINELYQDKIIDDRKDLKKTGFSHHIIQEFITAKNCLRFDDVVKQIDTLAVIKEKGLLAINPSWYGVIRFLLESKKYKEILRWLFDFAHDHKEVVDEYFSNSLTSIDISLLSKEEQSEIFELIFRTYQEKTVWLPTWSRDQLAKLCSKEQILKLKNEIELEGIKTENIVRWSNILEIIGGILEFRPEDIKNDRDFWEKKLIKLIKIDDDENGVLKRKSLEALGFYHKTELVRLVEPLCTNHKDTLVREAFVRFCSETDPNNEDSVRCVAEGIKNGVDIYGRHCLYRIDKKEGIGYLLNQFLKNEGFLEMFLDKESIFNKEKNPQDKIIIDKIVEFLDKELFVKIKQILKFAFGNTKFYDLENSYFLKELMLIVSKNDEKYIFEAIKNIENNIEGNRWHLLLNYKSLFSWILKKEDLTKFFDEIKKLDEGEKRIAEMAVWGAFRTRGEEGLEIKNEAVKLGLIEDLKPAKKEIEPSEKLINEFRKLLDPAPGKYFPTVFEFYNRNKKELDLKITKDELDRLKKLTFDEILEKADPKKVIVKINNFGTDGARNYNITGYVQYYGDAVRTAQILDKNKLKKYRQNLIDFIPFAYSDDRSTIAEIVKKIDDSELKWVNKMYSDKDNNIRYFLPSAYLETIGNNLKRKQNHSEIVEILKSFIGDEKISGYDQRHTLKVIGKLIDKQEKNKKYFEDIFIDSVDSEDETKIILAEIANRILIKKFEDDKAIDWRIEKIKLKQEEIEGFVQETGCHSVGDIENEISWKPFAKPLIKLKNPKYFEKFIPLLDLSVERLKNEQREKVWPFVIYLWDIFFGYLENVELGSKLDLIKKTEEWSRKNKDVDGMNWFQQKVKTIETKYLLEEGKRRGLNGNLR